MKIIQLLLTALLLSAPAWANVPNATPLFNQYTCNSATTQFPYGFPITASSDMTAYLTDTSGNTTQLSTSVFSVDTTNVWVNYPLVGSPCPNNYLVTLRPSTPQTQTTTYGARTPFTATAVGASFDKLTLISQQLQGQINRTFLQPANVTSQVTFPSSSPGNYIGWNGSGVLANIPSPSNAAVWSLSGANAVYNLGNVSTSGTLTASTSGSSFVSNVGIGSTSPGQALDVQGTIRATNFSGPLTGNITGNASGTSATVTTAVQPAITSVGTLTSLLVSGNVGIGSASPGQVLDINGTIRAKGFSGPLVGSTTAFNTGTIYQAATDGYITHVFATGTNPTTINLYSDSSATPSTVVDYLVSHDTGGQVTFKMSVLIKKGNYYEIVISAGSISSTNVGPNFIAIGS